MREKLPYQNKHSIRILGELRHNRHIRCDSTANSPVSLLFSRSYCIDNSSVTATAVLQKGSLIEPRSEILPFAMEENVWDTQNPGDQWSFCGDGRIEDVPRSLIPGNWGTLDIGSTSNRTSDLMAQIIDGLRQSDLDGLYNDGRIPSSEHIDSQVPWYANSDTGLSSGMKSAIQAIHGMTRLVPIYDSVGVSGGSNGNGNGSNGGGNNGEFHVVACAVVQVVGSNWQGANNTYVQIKKSYTDDGKLKPQTDLSNTSSIIEGAYTSPVLFQ